MNMPIPLSWLEVSGFRHLYRTDEHFRAFAAQLIDYLYGLRVGHSVTFRRYTGKKLEWCIRCAAAFLTESDNWKYYELTDDRLTITHRWQSDDTAKLRDLERRAFRLKP